MSDDPLPTPPPNHRGGKTFFCPTCTRILPAQGVKRLREDTFIHEIAVYMQDQSIKHYWHQVHERTWDPSGEETTPTEKPSALSIVKP